jgi:hypothetical protein
MPFSFCFYRDLFGASRGRMGHGDSILLEAPRSEGARAEYVAPALKPELPVDGSRASRRTRGERLTQQLPPGALLCVQANPEGHEVFENALAEPRLVVSALRFEALRYEAWS